MGMITIGLRRKMRRTHLARSPPESPRTRTSRPPACAAPSPQVHAAASTRDGLRGAAFIVPYFTGIAVMDSVARALVSPVGPKRPIPQFSLILLIPPLVPDGEPRGLDVVWRELCRRQRSSPCPSAALWRHLPQRTPASPPRCHRAKILRAARAQRSQASNHNHNVTSAR